MALLPRRVHNRQILLQPDSKIQPAVRADLPDFFFWSPQITAAVPARKLFVKPGHSEPFPKTPHLDAPPQLEVPNWETRTSHLKVASSPDGAPNSMLSAGTTMPIRVPGPPEEQVATSHVSVDRNMGDPTNVLSLSDHPIPMQSAISVPPGSQAGNMGERANSGAAGRGSESASGTATNGSGAGRGSQTAQEDKGGTGPGAGERAGSGQHQPSDAGQNGHSGEHDALAKNVGAGESGAAASSVKALLAAAGDGAGGAVGVQEATVEGVPAAVAATKIVHSGSGVFDVVVQSTGLEGFLESGGVLSGKPVYSVYVQAGGPKDWILQYCIPASEDNTASVSGAVVTLSNPAPIAAPYPRVTYRPNIPKHPGSYVMVHGFISAEGRFERLRVLENDFPQETGSFPSVLKLWEFRPATRDGKPVRVETLLAIPAE